MTQEETSRHTPGPWMISTRDISLTSNPAQVFVISSEQGEIAETFEHWDDSVDQANATLIAAAPDLLAAAELVLDCPKGGRDQCREVLRQAAALARGEAQS